MTTQAFIPAGDPPEPPIERSGKLAVDEPLIAQIPTPRNLWGIVLPITLVVGVGGLIVAMYMSGMRSMAGGVGLFGVMMLFGMVGMLFRNRGNSQRMPWGELEKGRGQHLSRLDDNRDEVEAARRAQWDRAMFWHWDPDRLVGVVGSVRMWERATGSERFGEVRLGLGTVNLGMELVWPQIPEASRIEPATGHALRKFVLEQPHVRDAPKVLWLQRFAGLSFVGDMDEVRGTARAVVCQIAAFHSPADVQIIVVTSAPQQWDWIKWLPHVQHQSARDGCGERRMVFTSPADLETFIGGEQMARGEWKAPPAPRPGQSSGAAAPSAGPTPLWVIIDDNCGSAEDWAGMTGRKGYAGTCFIRLAPSVPQPPPRVGLEPQQPWLGFDEATTYRLSEGTLRKKSARDAATVAVNEAAGPFYARADALTVGQAERFARAMAPYRPAGAGSGVHSAADIGQRTLLDVLGIADARRLDTDRLWAARQTQGAAWMKFPVGVDSSGQVVEVDLKEGSQGGWGMHSIHIGTTGAGKSQAILTEVASLALTHSPEVLNVVFADWKLESIGTTLKQFPHVVASTSNLTNQQHLVGRMYEALEGELVRRGELCARLGITDLTEYNKLRLTNHNLAPIPAIYIIWDEYQELFGDEKFGRKYQDLAWRIVRQGRSYHMFLKLVGQTVDGQKLRNIRKLQGFTTAMRTGTGEDSREAIGSDIAAKLAASGDEGTAYVRVALQVPRKFRYFFLSNTFLPPLAALASSPTSTSTWFEPRPFVAEFADDIDGRVAAPEPEDTEGEDPAAAQEAPAPMLTESGQEVKVAGVIIDSLNAAGVRPPRELWLPPLDESTPADELVRRFRGKPWDRDYGRNPGIVFPVGIEDRPREALQIVHTLDLTSAHALVVGAPQAGATTALQTMILTGALLYRPERVQFYCIAAGGPQLSTVAGLPHVAFVAQVTDAEGVQRVISAVENIIADREVAFARTELDIDEFRRRKFGPNPVDVGIAGGDVVLVIDGWSTLVTAHPALEDPAMRLLRGLNYGVRVVFSNTSYLSGVRHAIRTAATAGLELALSKPEETVMHRDNAKRLSAEGKPGSANTRDGVELLIGVPELAESGQTRLTGRDVTAAVVAVAGEGETASMARLPEVAPIATVVAAARSDRPKTLIPFGLKEADLSAAYVDLAAEPHVVAVGATKSGRTNFLRVLCEQIMATFTPAEAQIFVFDPLRTLAGVVTDPAYLREYAYTHSSIARAVQNIRAEIDTRVPTGGSTQADLLARRGHEGPRMFVVIDNVSTWNSVESPFNPLTPLVEQGGAVGLHLLTTALAQSWMNMAALPSSFIGKIKATGTPTLVLDGRRDLGKIAGEVKGAPMRPGKAFYVTRATTSTVLIGWSDPPYLPNL